MNSSVNDAILLGKQLYTKCKHVNLEKSVQILQTRTVIFNHHTERTTPVAADASGPSIPPHLPTSKSSSRKRHSSSAVGTSPQWKW